MPRSARSAEAFNRRAAERPSMSTDSEYEPVYCPVDGCAYEDAVRSVAAHVSGTDDGDHEWDRLGYDGALGFVKEEKRRQEADGSRAETDACEPSAGMETSAATENRDVDADRSDGPLDLSFARDAVAVAALSRQYEADALADLDPFRLANLYALLSSVENAAGDARTEVRDALLNEVQDDREIESDLGAVRRSTYQRTRLRDEETVQEALERAGVDPSTVTSFDRGKVEDAVAESPLDPSEVFDTEKRARVRRTGVDRSGVDEALRDVDVKSLVGD